MNAANLLTDAFGRIEGIIHNVVDGLTPEQLSFRVDSAANSIAWLVWHLTRVQDDHIADASGMEQASRAPGAPRFSSGRRSCDCLWKELRGRSVGPDGLEPATNGL
jgi:hypothetical protein